MMVMMIMIKSNNRYSICNVRVSVQLKLSHFFMYYEMVVDCLVITLWS